MQGGLLPGSELGHPSPARRTAWRTGTEMPSACLLCLPCLPGAAVLSATCVKEPGRVAGAEVPPELGSPPRCVLPQQGQATPWRVGPSLGASSLLHLPGPPRCTRTSHPRGEPGLSPHPPACQGVARPPAELASPRGILHLLPSQPPLGRSGDPSMLESPWDRAVMARPAFTDQGKVNLRYLLLGLTGRGSSSWKGLDLIISTSLASKLSPKPGSSEPMPSVTSNKVGWSLQFLMGSAILRGVRELSYCCYVMSAASGKEQRARAERGSGEAAARAEGRRRWSQPERAGVSISRPA